MEAITPESNKSSNPLFKRVFLDHWIDWTIAIIVTVFIVVYGAVQKFSIEQDYNVENKLSVSSTNQGIKIISTTAWQTYTSREFNFEFLYPDSWSVSQREPELEVKNTILGPVLEDDNASIAQIDFTIFSNPEGTSLLPWFMKKSGSSASVANLANQAYEPFTIGTIDGIKVTERDSVSGKLDTNIFFSRDGKVLLFHATDKDIQTLQALVSTFRFIDFSDPRNWEVYKSKKNDISLRPKPGLRIMDEDNGLIIGNCPDADIGLFSCDKGDMFTIQVYDGSTIENISPNVEIKCKNIKINSHASYDCSFGTIRKVYAQEGNVVFDITYPINSTDGDKMLSTLEFLGLNNDQIGFYDRNKWQLIDSKSADFDGDGVGELVLLLKSNISPGKDYEGNDLFFLRMLIIKNNTIVYSFEPRNGVRGPFLMSDKVEIQDVTQDGLPEAIVYWGDKQMKDTAYTSIHVAHFDSQYKWLNNISSDGFYNSKWHDFEWADFGDKLQIATSDAIRNTCSTCIDYYKYTIYKWIGDHYMIYKSIEGPKNPVGNPFDEEYIKFIHDKLN